MNDNIACKNHDDSLFLFYCFDDQSYLCSECFKDHRTHKIEIKADLKKVSDFIKLVNKSGIKNMKSFLENTEKNLKKLKVQIEQLLLEIHNSLEKFNNIEECKNVESITNLKYEDYETLFNCIDIQKKSKEISIQGTLIFKRLKNNGKEFIITSKFNIINKEVIVLENSETYKEYPVDILLGKSKKNQYTIFNVIKQHYLCVDLTKKYYLNSIRIQTTTDPCSLKNFDILIKETDSKTDNWIKINSFTKTREIKDNQYQSFEIGFFCRLVKIIFIDNWGGRLNGNYIIIKSIDYEVGE